MGWLFLLIWAEVFTVGAAARTTGVTSYLMSCSLPWVCSSGGDQGPEGANGGVQCLLRLMLETSIMPPLPQCTGQS